jgi:hypothetical protein
MCAVVRVIAPTISAHCASNTSLLYDGGDVDGKLTSSKWAAIAKCSLDTALRDITDLLARGILRKSDAGGAAQAPIQARARHRRAQEFAGNSQEIFQRNKQQPPQLDHDGLLRG